MAEKRHLQAVGKFYSVLESEIAEAGYSREEISLLGDGLYYDRYLNPTTRNYVEQTFFPNIADVIPYFQLDKGARPCILDLGCGLGMQALIFASFGARVIGVDIREDSISLCRKRKTYYQKKLNLKLDAEFIHCDFRRVKKGDFSAKFDCLFSMSAFSYMSPLESSVKTISSILKNGSKVFLYEENAACLFRSLKPVAAIPSPRTVLDAFAAERYRPELFHGGCTLPHQFWRLEALNPILRPLNNFMRRNPHFGFTYVLGMKRAPAGPKP